MNLEIKEENSPTATYAKYSFARRPTSGGEYMDRRKELTRKKFQRWEFY